MTPRQFVDCLSKLQFPNAFNPYYGQCPVHDLHDAPRIRSRVLLEVLEAAVKRDVDSMWIGRDLGYRGGRRTGLAFTDDLHMHEYANRWGVSVGRSTVTDTYSERTATVVWSVLSRITVPVFLWNVFPLHPYEPGNPFSNRSHNRSERNAGRRLLAQVIYLVKPRRLVAIGNDAARAVSDLSVEGGVEYVRHPSYGGKALFVSRISELYHLDTKSMETHATTSSGRSWVCCGPRDYATIRGQRDVRST